MVIAVIVIIVLAVYLGAWALCRMSAIADTYHLRKGKPPSEWR